MGNMSMFGMPGQYPAVQQNFIETLFRFAMDQGPEKLSLLFFLQLYCYLSLDYIKAAFKYINDKIAVHGRAKLEQYCSQLANMVYGFFSFIYTLSISWVSELPTRLWRKWMRYAPPPAQTNETPVIIRDVIHKHTVKLDPSNTIDLIALGHYLLTPANRKSLKLNNYVERTTSTKKSATVHYTIPENLVIGQANANEGPIKIQLVNRINLKYETESDRASERVKKYLCDRLSSADADKNKKVSGGKIAQFKEVMQKLWGDKNVYCDDPPFWYNKGDWSCDPESMTNTEHTVLWRVLYYIGDVNIVRKFMLYLLGEESFRFDEKTYDKADDNITGEFKEVFKDKATLEGYLNMIPDYHAKFIQNLEEQNVKPTIDELAKKFMSKFQMTKGSDGNTKIAITFTSKCLDEYQLAKFGRIWYHKLIEAYYEQTQKKTGEKVRIYKLNIVYDIRTVEEPNPKYIQYEKEQAEELQRREEQQALAIQQATAMAAPPGTAAAAAATTAADAAAAAAASAATAAAAATATATDATSTATTAATATTTTTTTATVTTTTAPTPAATAAAAAAAAAAPILLGPPGEPERRRSRSRGRGRKGGRRNRRGDSDSDSDNDWDGYSGPGGPGGGAVGYMGSDLFDGEYPDWRGGGGYDIGSAPRGYPDSFYPTGGKKKGKGKQRYWHGSDYAAGGYYQGSSYKPIPPKTIKVEHKIPSAQAKLIKEDRKPLEYLYLPEESMDTLVEYLRNFKDHRDRFQKYGFPYRGGLILSGAPGCGKSSTILATATYLQKDIFYLDLGQIKTNNELKLCVDYIRTNSQNGGVIIFEDIDCMSGVVHQRKDQVELSTETNLTKIAEEGDCPLSLSYLLNVLDGTMAPEDVIFIMTTNHIEKLDPALIRPGRIDLNIELTKCTRVQLAKIYNDLYSKDLHPDILARFPERHWITAKVILHLFHNSFDANIDQEMLIAPLLNTDSDELDMYKDD
jgi:hypothetical protein